MSTQVAAERRMSGTSGAQPKTAVEGARPTGLSREKRAVVIQHTLAAMDQMGFDDAQKLALLGLSSSARSTLHRYRTGQSVPEAADQMERCANILRIAAALKHLFPEGADHWLHTRPPGIADRSILDTMLTSFEGLTRTRGLIEAELQR